MPCTVRVMLVVWVLVSILRAQSTQSLHTAACNHLTTYLFLHLFLHYFVPLKASYWLLALNSHVGLNPPWQPFLFPAVCLDIFLSLTFLSLDFLFWWCHFLSIWFALDISESWQPFLLTALEPETWHTSLSWQTSFPTFVTSLVSSLPTLFSSLVLPLP